MARNKLDQYMQSLGFKSAGEQKRLLEQAGDLSLRPDSGLMAVHLMDWAIWDFTKAGLLKVMDGTYDMQHIKIYEIEHGGVAIEIPEVTDNDDKEVIQ